MDALDECVLGHDQAVDHRGVVLDPLHEAAPLELSEEPKLADLCDGGHDSEILARASTVSGSSAASASYSRAWNVPGPSAPAAASSAATS